MYRAPRWTELPEESPQRLVHLPVREDALSMLDEPPESEEYQQGLMGSTLSPTLPYLEAAETRQDVLVGHGRRSRRSAGSSGGVSGEPESIMRDNVAAIHAAG